MLGIDRSLGVRGSKIFNVLPENIINMNSEYVDLFKNHLDVFLSSIPDNPALSDRVGKGS